MAHYFDTFSDTASGNDIEGTAHCMLHYFFDAVMPILQAFYTKFYIPEKDMYPAEVENTDKLARAFVVGTIREYVSIATMTFTEKVLTANSRFSSSVLNFLLYQM